MLKDVSRSSSVANMSSIQMEEMIVKLRKENKKLKEDDEYQQTIIEGYSHDLDIYHKRSDTLKKENEELKEDKLDLSQKIDNLTKELKQCHAIFSRQAEERQERKQNKKKWEEIKRFKKK